MYIDELQIENFRCFSKQSVQFMHPDSPRAAGVRFPNVNVVLGANGVGKTTLLKAAAIIANHPFLSQSGFRPYQMIRKITDRTKKQQPRTAILTGIFQESDTVIKAKTQGEVSAARVLVELQIARKGDEEILELASGAPLSIFEGRDYDDNFWRELYFVVAYGAMRRVERLPSYEMEAQNQQYSYRYSRMANLFDSRVVLIPLVSWLAQLPNREKKQILELFASLMPSNLEFSDSIDGREFSFYHNKILVPFDALADGHRSYIGWVSDLLYHLHRVNPKNVQDVHGVVLVDEVDLLAHPTWQRTIVPDLSKAFPKLQFILTTHSPIVAASVEAANLFILNPRPNGTANITQPDAEVYGLNAQQVLHEVFGMESTRAPGFEKELQKLAKKSRAGDRVAARALTQGLAFGAGKPELLEDDSELAEIQKAAQALLENKL
jgi:predicted ATP-binding protein involved in virulence